MLSYRHSFHAGNFADVLKHSVLIELLEHFCKKDKAFSYIDSHAGAGLYNLQSAHAEKTGEYRQGIGKLMQSSVPELNSYLAAVKATNQPNALTFYPGSPLIALQYLRSLDRAWLYELHPDDNKRLTENTKGMRNVRVLREDGLQGVLAQVPPVSRRALVLIDPSYEIKTEYDAVIDCVIKAHKKFSTGTYAIWYPVVDRKRAQRMLRQLSNSGIRNIQNFELGLQPDSPEAGMTSSGMLVINPSWTLMDHMQKLLPQLVTALGEHGKAFYKAEVVVPE